MALFEGHQTKTTTNAALLRKNVIVVTIDCNLLKVLKIGLFEGLFKLKLDTSFVVAWKKKSHNKISSSRYYVRYVFGFLTPKFTCFKLNTKLKLKNNMNLISSFQKIEQPFLQAAKTTLGDRYTPNIENIYKITIKFILENLVKGYEESGVENGKGETWQDWITKDKNVPSNWSYPFIVIV